MSNNPYQPTEQQAKETAVKSDGTRATVWASAVSLMVGYSISELFGETISWYVRHAGFVVQSIFETGSIP